eukprot:6421793-Pyramimonas_sp.AAC.1
MFESLAVPVAPYLPSLELHTKGDSPAYNEQLIVAAFASAASQLCFESPGMCRRIRVWIRVGNQ